MSGLQNSPQPNTEQLFGTCTLSRPDVHNAVTCSFFLFNTINSIKLYPRTNQGEASCHELEETLTTLFQHLIEFEKALSRTRPDSDISRINQAPAQERVSVSALTYTTLEQALFYCDTSSGLFDITVGSLTRLCDFAHHIVPTREQIGANLPLVNYQAVHLGKDEQELWVSKDLDRLYVDVGGTAKGVIADYARAFLIERGFTQALINLGGNTIALGAPPHQPHWIAGIKDPFGSGTPCARLKLKDAALVTSGTYERAFTDKHGQLYHHILDPRTGMPANTDIVSATIVSPSASLCDGISTVPVLLGSKDSFDYLAQFEGAEAFLVTTTGKTLATPGMKELLL